MPTCTSPTAPTPITFPISIWKGVRLEISTSTIRLVFSSITALMT